MVAYVPNWCEPDLVLPRMDRPFLTHVNLAFENPLDMDGNISFAKVNEAYVQRARQVGIKVLVSLGGGSASEDPGVRSRYFHLIQKEHCESFVEKLLNYVKVHQLDGLDIDLEGPAINPDYGHFIESLATRLHHEGKIITAALSYGYGGKEVPLAPLRQFDFINVMAYDASGPWNANAPGPHSSMEFARSSIQQWIDRGIEPSRLVLGLPFYGYGFGKDFNQSGYANRKILELHPGSERKDQAGKRFGLMGWRRFKLKWHSRRSNNSKGS